MKTVRPNRKSPRAPFCDYCDGNFFVTICTKEKENSFGEIRNGMMQYSNIGKYCDIQLREIELHYPYAKVLVHQVMPNHIHAIVSIEPDGNNDIPKIRPLLGVVIGGMKRAVTMFARRNHEVFGWQTRYHDHLIRGTKDYNMIWEYIENNVERWQSDCFNLWDKN
ncbi:MAG: transposase [Muribaculaceae bacterium]|nr:transposase [Muribaculaceae bacterium]